MFYIINALLLILDIKYLYAKYSFANFLYSHIFILKTYFGLQAVRKFLSTTDLTRANLSHKICTVNTYFMREISECRNGLGCVACRTRFLYSPVLSRPLQAAIAMPRAIKTRQFHAVAHV